MFGHYYRSLDEKNRVMIPSKQRELLGEIFYITIGPDNVLEIRDQESFTVLRNKLTSVNMLNANARKFARILLGNTIEVSCDKQGRVTLPETFLLKSNITKEVAFVGVGNKIEIWPKEAYVDFQNSLKGEGDIDKLAKELLKDGVEI